MNRFFQARFCTNFRHLPSKQPFSSRNTLLSLRTIVTPAKAPAPSKTPCRSLSNGPTTIAPAKTWVDRLPARVRPYLYLTRIDKPIGTLLLFYPCGVFIRDLGNRGNLNEASRSMVNYNGCIRAGAPIHHTPDVYQPLWRGCVGHARCGMYHQRPLGQEFG